MPGLIHEALAKLFQHRPDLAAALLAGQGRVLPAYDEAQVLSAELNELVPVEFTADALIVLRAAGKPVLAVVVEIQLRRDRDKPWVWPVYVATARQRLRCPAWLLVICPSESAAQACREPFEFWSPGTSLHPLVLGPVEVPLVADPDQAREFPELAVLSAIVHQRSPELPTLLDAAVQGLQQLPPDQARTFIIAIAKSLPRAAAAGWETLVAASKLQALLDEDLRQRTARLRAEAVEQGLAEGRAEGRAEGLAEGKAEGKAESVLALLRAREVAVSAAARERILSCANSLQLESWLIKAASADTIADVFS